jgi:hypothetical protein
MTIALLCPTRARPELCLRMLNSAYATSGPSVNPYVALTEGFEELPIIASSNTTNSLLRTPDGMPTAYKWDLLAKKAMEDKDNKLFMLAADDIIFTTPDWDKALLDHYNSLENKIHVYALRDSRDFDGTPHPIVTREYIEAMGYFLPPIFLHWFVDSWTVEIAKHNGCFTHLNNYELVHDKPNDRGQPDETHNRIREMGWLERDQYVNEKCQHFLALEKSRLKMRMSK